MKNTCVIAIIVLSNFLCPFAFAEAVANTNATITNATTTGGLSGNSSGLPKQSTTYTATTSTTTSNDDKIVAAVYAKYAKEPALIGTALTVTSQNGTVTISGTVTAQSQADEASIAAKSVPGVTNVNSLVNVTTNPNLNDKAAKTPNY